MQSGSTQAVAKGGGDREREKERARKRERERARKREREKKKERKKSDGGAVRGCVPTLCLGNNKRPPKADKIRDIRKRICNFHDHLDSSFSSNPNWLPHLDMYALLPRRSERQSQESLLADYCTRPSTVPRKDKSQSGTQCTRLGCQDNTCIRSWHNLTKKKGEKGKEREGGRERGRKIVVRVLRAVRKKIKGVFMKKSIVLRINSENSEQEDKGGGRESSMHMHTHTHIRRRHCAH